MFYVFLLLGVITLLSLVAWRFPSRRRAPVFVNAQPPRGVNPISQADPATSELVARVLKGERKEDKPCLTPIDCVEQNRCDGHCGCH